MRYKIIGDSCCDLTGEDKQDERFGLIPLTLEVGDARIRDDESFDQRSFLDLVKACKVSPKSACPSPEEFIKAFECDAEMIFVVTLSEHLSGTYNSAKLAAQIYKEEHGDKKKIEVFSSDSASSGETLVAMKIKELAEAGYEFEDIVKKTRDYLWNMDTYFVLESLDTLKKNGRLTGLQALFATALSIKPIMGADHGVIIKLDQARGINKALNKMCEHVVSKVKNAEEKVLGIAHCNCRERADFVKNKILSMIKVKDVYVVDTAGVSTMYANEGGVIVAI